MKFYKAPIQEVGLLKHGDIVLGKDNKFYQVRDSINDNRVHGCTSCSFYNRGRHDCRSLVFKVIISDYTKLSECEGDDRCPCGSLIKNFCEHIRVRGNLDTIRRFCFKEIQKEV